jgi:hypothetical protein
MDVDERISIEKRMGHMERELATHSALVKRNAEILDDIRKYINEPKRLPEWIAAMVAVLGGSGALLYAAYIAPLEGRVDRVEGRLEILDNAVGIVDEDHCMNSHLNERVWSRYILSLDR